MNDVRQLKLVTGEEILCEILDWADEQEGDIVIRNAFKVKSRDDDIRGLRYFSLKPWMVFQEGDDVFITLNIMNVVAQAKPTQKILDQYDQAVINSNLTEEDINNKIEEYIRKLHGRDDMDDDSDDDFNNLIYFPGTDKLH